MIMPAVRRYWSIMMVVMVMMPPPVVMVVVMVLGKLDVSFRRCA